MIITVALLPLLIQPHSTLTDEWAQKPFFEEPDLFDRVVNYTTYIELAVTQTPTNGQTTSSVRIGKAHSRSVRNVYE